MLPLTHVAAAALGGVLAAVLIARVWTAWQASRAQQIRATPDRAHGIVDRLREGGVGAWHGADRGVSSGAEVGRAIGSAVGFAVDVFIRLLIEIAEDTLGGRAHRLPFGLFRWIYGELGAAIGALVGAAFGGAAGTTQGLFTGRAAPPPPYTTPPRRLSQPPPSYGRWR